MFGTSDFAKDDGWGCCKVGVVCVVGNICVDVLIVESFVVVYFFSVWNHGIVISAWLNSGL